MCTAITYKTNDFYFGRTLDYDVCYPSEITITPRNFPFLFREAAKQDNHYAIIGMACNTDDLPLYFDAVNEKGLCMAGLNFVGNAVYSKRKTGKDNIAQFELIPWILGKCATIKQVRELLCNINITDTAFNDDLPVSPLHWIIADKNEALTLEAVAEGIRIYDNPIGVLTNNPPFPMQMTRLNDYMQLSNKEPRNNFSCKIPLKTYSRGMGAIGLPGDLSSQSRFIRAAFVKLNSVSEKTESKSISQFFHILGSVEQQQGCCETENGKYEITLYTSCCNADKGIYYYTTYNNRSISAVDMRKEDLNSGKILRFPLNLEPEIILQN